MRTPVAFPEDPGISSLAVEAFLDGAQAQGLDFHSVILMRHGKVAVRLNWAPYTLDTPHTLFSLSKSFCSAAAGFAVAEGLLSYEDKVLDVLKDKAPANPDKGLAKVTLRHLLTMSSGLEPRSDTRELRVMDWVARALTQKTDHEPGTHFHYNTTGTYLVSAMVHKVTGMPIRDYLMPRLFDKLGIVRPQWDVCPMGINAGGYGLHLSCEDIARFGQLLLQDGMWEGERVLPEGWVKMATDKSIDTADKPEDSDWAQGYGFQFWRTRGGRFRGDGMFGQVCMVDQKQDLVLAVTAGIADMGAEMNLLRDTLLNGAGMKPAAQAKQRAIKKRAEALSYPLLADDFSGRDLTGSYFARGNRRLRVEMRADGRVALQLTRPIYNLCFSVKSTTPHTGEATWGIPMEAPEAYRGSCGFADGALHFEVRFPGAPYTYQGILTPRGDDLELTMKGAGSDAGTFLYKRA